MKNLKKKFKRQINPERSNKMIWAVSIGILILFSVLFFLTTGNDSNENKSELFNNTLNYMKNIEGIANIESLPETNSVKIFFNPDPNSRSGIDYKRITIFAGIKISNKLKDEKVTARLIRNKDKKTILTVTILNGRVISKTQL